MGCPRSGRVRRQIAYLRKGDDTQFKIRTSLRGMVVDERGCTPPAPDVATGTSHQLMYQLLSSSLHHDHLTSDPGGVRGAVGLGRQVHCIIADPPCELSFGGNNNASA
jgi:hypothetical protein